MEYRVPPTQKTTQELLYPDSAKLTKWPPIFSYGLTITRSGWRDDMDLRRSTKSIVGTEDTYNWIYEFERTKRGWLHAHCYFQSHLRLSSHTREGKNMHKLFRKLNEGDFVKWEYLKDYDQERRWINYIKKQYNHKPQEQFSYLTAPLGATPRYENSLGDFRQGEYPDGAAERAPHGVRKSSKEFDSNDPLDDIIEFIGKIKTEEELRNSRK